MDAMPLETLMVGGPAGSGKTTVVHFLVDEVIKRPVHFLRLRRAGDGLTNAVARITSTRKDEGKRRWASVHEVSYTADGIFEIIPDVLRHVRQLERKGFVIVEADSDSFIRYAYPFHHCLFVMPVPDSVYEVFREPMEATVALREVMRDTAAFAENILGLFEGDPLGDLKGVEHRKETVRQSLHGDEHHLESLTIRESQLNRFVRSPLGMEIASRIQLQPAYHSAIEADAILINQIGEGESEALKETVRRLEILLGRLRDDGYRQSILFRADMVSMNDSARKRLVAELTSRICS